MKATGLGLILVAVLASGCMMFGAWRSIPPPGGCDQCHALEISTNWKATMTVAVLSAEDGTPPWQQEASVAPPVTESPLQQQMLSDSRCFRCHREPDRAHRDYRGSYHHQ